MSIFLDNEQLTGAEAGIDNARTIIKAHTTRLRDDIADQVLYLFNMIWNHPRFSAPEIIESFGTDGASLFILCTTLQNLLKSIDPDWVWLSPPEKWSITLNQDGSVKVEEL